MHIRVALLGSYPSWDFRDRLELKEDTSHIRTTWNRNLAEALARRGDCTVLFIILAGFVSASQSLVFDDHLSVRFVRMPRIVKGLDYVLGHRLSKILIARELKQFEPHLVHGIGTEHPYGYVSTLLPYKSLLTVHGYMRNVLERGAKRKRMIDRIRAWYEARALRRTKNVITISPYIEDQLPSVRIARRSINNAISPVYFTEAKPRPRHNDLLFVGMLQHRKGVDLLIDAMEALAKEEIRPSLIIVGPSIPAEARYADFLRDRVERSAELRGRIQWVGAKDADEIHEFMLSSRILVLPSREETAPMVIAEAMACGAAVVAARVGGVEFMLDSHSRNFLVRPNDTSHLAEMLGAALNEWDKAVSDGVRRLAYERYHPDQVAAETVEFYREILDRSEPA